MSAQGDVWRSGDQKHKPHVDISLVLLQTLYILKRRPNSLHTAANGSTDVTQRLEILTDPVFTTARKHLLLFIRPDRSQSYLRVRYHTKPWSMEWKNSVEPTQRKKPLLLNKSNERSDIQSAGSKHFRQGGDVTQDKYAFISQK